MSGCIGGDLRYDQHRKIAYKLGPGRCMTEVALGGCGSPCCRVTVEHLHFMSPCCASDAKLNPPPWNGISEFGDVDEGATWFRRLAGLGAVVAAVCLGRR